MLPKQVLDALRLMPKETHPMDMLRTGVSMLAPFDPELNDHSHAANIRKSIRLIAKVSTLITDGYRIRAGRTSAAGTDGSHPGGKFFLQTERRSAAGLADPNDGHDFYSVCRSRIQRFDFCGAGDRIDAGRYVCGGDERVRHLERPVARRRE